MQSQYLFENSPAAMFIWDFETKLIQDCNNAALELYGYSKEEFLQLTIYDIRPENEIAKIKTTTENIDTYTNIFNGFHKDYWIHKKKNGEIIYVQVNGHMVEFNNKKASFVIVLDVTEKYLAEEKQKISEQNYKTLFQLSPLPRFNFDLNNLQIINVNNAACNVYGYSAIDLLEMSITNLVIESEKQIFINAINQAKHQPNISQLGLFHHSKKNGELLKMNISGCKILFDNKECLLIVCLDVTENEKLIKTLESRNQFIETILKNLPIGIAVNEIDTAKATIVNDNFSKIYGWSNDEINDVEKFFHSVYPDKVYRNEIMTRVLSDIESKDPNRLEWKNIKITTKQGDIKYVNAKNIPLYDQNLMISTVIDVTNEFIQSQQIEYVKNNQEALINASDDLIWSIDNNYRIIAANQAFFNILKIVTAKEIKEGDMVFIPEFGPERNKKWKSYYNRAFLGEKFTIEDDIYDHIQKKHLYNIISFNPMFSKNGEIEAIACYSKDISFLKEAQTAIEKSNKRFEYVTKATFDAIWDWDIINNKVYWGENFEKLFGLMEVNEQITETEQVHKRLHPKEFTEIIQSVEHLLKSKDNNWEKEHLFKKTNGDFAYVSNKAIIIRDEKGRPIRAIGAMQDITNRKQEEQRLKLMESVIVNATDAVIITEAEPISGVGPIIIYVNEAFTNMTGYSAEEAIGKTPRILQGPKTDKKELDKVRKALENWEACEATILNYRKNGEPFWINFSITPVADDTGWFTHWIAIEREVTETKKQEIKKQFFNEISLLFTTEHTLITILKDVIKLITELGGYFMGEIWLANSSKHKIQLSSQFVNTNENYIELSENNINQFNYGEGLPGMVWQQSKMEIWEHLQKHQLFLRKDLATNNKLNAAIGVPLTDQNDFIGVLILFSQEENNQFTFYEELLKDLEHYLGAEIKRKKIEDELNRIFNTAPDIISISNTEGYFIKINPAGCALLEYTEEELLSKPYSHFIHPEDREKTINESINIAKGRPVFYFENRYITKTGKTIWLAWSATPSTEEQLIFGVAKDITEQKKLAELLNASNKLAKIGSWEVNLIKNEIYWSNITKEIHEVSQEYVPELISGINFYKEGEDRDTITNLIQEAIAEGKDFDTELRIITAQHNVKWVRVIGQTEFREGRCIRVYGSFQDIDFRKKAEIELHQTYEERNQILESIGDAFYTVDKMGNITYWNNQAEKLLEKTRDSVLGKNITTVFQSELTNKFYQQINQALTLNQASTFDEFDQVTNKWFEASIYPSTKGYSVYLKDISLRKIAEEQIKQSNERFTNVVKATNDAIWDWDVENDTLYWGEGFKNIFGIEYGFVAPTESTWLKYIHPDDIERTLHNFNETIADPTKQNWIFEYRFRNAVNNYVYVIDRAIIIRNNNGEVTRVVGAMIDITYRIEFENSLRKLNEQLDERAKQLAISNTELEQFAYIASHDLQEPLRMVSSFLTQLEKKYANQLDDKAKKYIDLAVDGSKRMRQIILDLLEFSRVGRIHATEEKINLNELVKDSIKLIQKIIEEKQVEIKVDKLPIITSYRSPLIQVFQNLITNSIKYSKEGIQPKIRINCTEKTTYYQISITDNGIGIDSSYFEKIFVIFQRLHARDEYSGTGMGLAIAKKIIENLKGSIWVESVVGKGSTFYFTLPK